jgi:hypothetical protein
MRKHIRLAVVLVLVVFVFAGCTVRHGDFTVLSNKLVDLRDFEVDKADRIRGVEGEDSAHIIILFPTKGSVTLEGALDDAFLETGGDLMTDAVVKQWFWYIPYIYGQSGWRVTGDMVTTRRK